MGEMFSSAVGRQAGACSQAQGKKPDAETAGLGLAIGNFWICPLTCTIHSPSPSSVHRFFLTIAAYLSCILSHPRLSSVVSLFSLLHVQGHLITLSGPLWLRKGSGVLQGWESCSMCFSTVRIVPFIEYLWCAMYFTLMASFISYHKLLNYYYSLNNFLVRNWGSSRLNKLPQLMKLGEQLDLNSDLALDSVFFPFCFCLLSAS